MVKKGVPALERDRVGHVGLNYLRPETYSRANAPLIDRQGSIPLAQAWGGGLVASVDGMRFVVPVPTIYARPNRKFFGPKRGITWLNMINDQAAGLGAKVISGTPRDSLHMIDVLYARDGGQRPDIVVTDTGSYSDLVFGLVHLLGMSYRPQLADLPDPAAVADQPGRRLTGRWIPRPAGRSTWARCAGTGRTSCGWPPPSTPAPSAPMRGGTGIRAKGATESLSSWPDRARPV